MASTDWFKTIITKKKPKDEKPKTAKQSINQELNGKLKSQPRKEPKKLLKKYGDSGMNIEDIAAIRIQTTFRRYRAKKNLRQLKRNQRLHVFTDRNYVKKQAANTSIHIQTWSKIQADIRARRANMVVEGRLRQKKQDNQQKLEAKLHDLEVEWCNGSETKEEIIARIQQREEAAVKRERTLAYAFSHQWRANSGFERIFTYDGKSNWGWSWVDQWIAARPWETRIQIDSSNTKKAQTKLPSKFTKNQGPSAHKVSVTVADTESKGSAKKESKSPTTETIARDSNLKLVSSPKKKTKPAKKKQEQLAEQVAQTTG